MTRFTHLITACYTVLLRMYPPRFRAEFADEMREVFAANVEDAVQTGFWAVLGLIVFEVVTLPANIGAAERLERQQNPAYYRPYRLRFMARYNSLWWGGMILVLSTQRLLHTGALGALQALQMLLAISVLAAWHWERTGGLLAAVGGAALCGLGLLGGYLSSQDQSLLIQVASMTIGFLWGTPFLIIGALFVRAEMTTPANQPA